MARNLRTRHGHVAPKVDLCFPEPLGPLNGRNISNL